MRKAQTAFLLTILILFSCSWGKPPAALINDTIEKMVLIDRAMDYTEEVTRIDIIDMTVFDDRVEVEVRVEGWAIHRDLTIGATLPASKSKKPGWAVWKFFCRKVDKAWEIVERYKVKEGFMEQESGPRSQ